MKKWIALALIVSLICTCGAFGALAEDSDIYSFTPSLINGVDATAVEWMGSAELRALATILLLDVSVTVGSDSALSPDLSRPTYIGRNGEDLVVYVHADGGSDLLILYSPGVSVGTFTTLDGASDEIVLAAMQASICPDGAYRNDEAAMLSVANDLQEIIGN